MIPVPREDIEVGMGTYATQGAPCEGRMKARDDDFVVQELYDPKGLSESWKPGHFPLYRVEKRHVDTMHMERELARILGSRVSYGGLKDGRSVSVQYVTPLRRLREWPQRVVAAGFVGEVVGFVPEPLSRSRVAGNSFEVVLRETCGELPTRVEETFRAGHEGRLPNYFGYQRFGSGGSGTHRVGEALVKRDFRRAVSLILSVQGEDVPNSPAGEAFESGDYAGGLRLLGPGQDIEALVARRMAGHPGEHVGAIRGVPIRLRRLYVQAYQSFIFNRTLTRAVEEGADISKAARGDNWAEAYGDGLSTSGPHGVGEVPSEKAVPMAQLVGYAYRDYASRFDGLIGDVLAEEGVSARDFYIKEMQEVSAEGGFRRLNLAVSDGSHEAEEGALRARFTLGRGQYATVLLREAIKPRDPAGRGFA